jgi:CRISPR/Cas system-associated exonuclease Cas4 (RecB family)
MQLSYSSLNIYKTCPRRYYLQYIVKAPKIEKPFEALEIGTKVHKVLEKTFQYGASMPLSDAYRRALAEMPEVSDVLQNFDPHMVFGENIIKTGGAEVTLGLDRNLRPSTFEEGFIRGKFDLIWISDHNIYILDFKTNRAKNADVEQLEFYAVLSYHYYKHFYPIKNVHVFFFYIRHEEPWFERTFDAHDISALTSRLLDDIATLEAEREWKPSAGPHCNWCPVAHYCPLSSQTNQPVNELTNEELIERYLATKAAADLLEEELKKRVEAGPIETKQYKAYYQKVIKRIPDPVFAKTILKEAGVTIDELLDSIQINQTFFKKFGLELPKEALVEKEEYRLKIETTSEES